MYNISMIEIILERDNKEYTTTCKSTYSALNLLGKTNSNFVACIIYMEPKGYINSATLEPLDYHDIEYNDLKEAIDALSNLEV